MMVREVNVIMADLSRATTCSWKHHTAEPVLERVLDDVAKVIARISRCQRTEEAYRSVYLPDSASVEQT